MSEIIYHATNGAAQRMEDADLPLKEQWHSVFSESYDITAAQFFDICGWRYEDQYFSRERPAIYGSSIKQSGDAGT